MYAIPNYEMASFAKKGDLGPEMLLIRCLVIEISVAKRPLAFLVNFTITSGKKYGE